LGQIEILVGFCSLENSEHFDTIIAIRPKKEVIGYCNFWKKKLSGIAVFGKRSYRLLQFLENGTYRVLPLK